MLYAKASKILAYRSSGQRIEIVFPSTSYSFWSALKCSGDFKYETNLSNRIFLQILYVIDMSSLGSACIQIVFSAIR